MNSLTMNGLTTGMAGLSQLVEAKLGPDSTRPPRPSWSTPPAAPIVSGVDPPIQHATCGHDRGASSEFGR